MKDVRLSKFLSQKQITKRGSKPKKIIDWFWNESILKIGLLVSTFFFLFRSVALDWYSPWKGTGQT